VTYLLGKTAPSENNGIVSAFAQFLIDECGPQLAESLYYAPITGSLLKQAQANAKTINAG
jgi:hypothetical protein